MADKSPRQAASKKASKSIKEKRADKRAAERRPAPWNHGQESRPAKKSDWPKTQLSLGVLEFFAETQRAPATIHPLHLERIAPEVRQRIILE